MATKNNPKNKGISGKTKTYNGKEIEPIMYDGTLVGNGKYLSAKFSKTTEIILDSLKGKPILWKDIPFDVK